MYDDYTFISRYLSATVCAPILNLQVCKWLKWIKTKQFWKKTVTLYFKMLSITHTNGSNPLHTAIWPVAIYLEKRMIT